MASLVTNTLPKLCGPSILEASNQWSKVGHVARRWSSTQSFGASPSQLPVPGEPGWAGFLANVERHSCQPPLSPAELQHGQEMYELKRKFDRMEKMFSEIIKSNDRLGGEVKHLIQKIHIDQPQN